MQSRTNHCLTQRKKTRTTTTRIKNEAKGGRSTKKPKGNASSNKKRGTPKNATRQSSRTSRHRMATGRCTVLARACRTLCRSWYTTFCCSSCSPTACTSPCSSDTASQKKRYKAIQYNAIWYNSIAFTFTYPLTATVVGHHRWIQACPFADVVFPPS